MPWAAAAAAAAAIGGAAIQSDSARSAANQQTAAANAAAGLQQQQFNVTRGDLAPFRDVGTSAVGKIRDLLGLQPQTQSIADIASQIRANFPNIQGSRELTDKVSDSDLVAGFMKYIPAAINDPQGATPDQVDKMRSILASAQQATAPGAQAGATPGQMSVSDIMALDPGYQFRLDQGSKAVTNAAGAAGMRNSGATMKALTRYGQDYASNEYGNIYNRLAGTAGLGQTATTNTAGFGANTAANIGNIYTGLGNARGASAIAQGNAYAGGLNTIGNYYTQNQMLDKILASRQPSYSGGAYYGSDYAG